MSAPPAPPRRPRGLPAPSRRGDRLVILLAVVAAAILAPILYPTSPWRMVQRPFMPPFTLDRFPLGTDALGRESPPV